MANPLSFDAPQLAYANDGLQAAVGVPSRVTDYQGNVGYVIGGQIFHGAQQSEAILAELNKAVENRQLVRVTFSTNPNIIQTIEINPDLDR